MPKKELSAQVQEELYQIEEADAWFEYLESVRGQPEPRYTELETWAWARLSQRRFDLRTRNGLKPQTT